jgi:hypothetical protein
MLMRGGRMTLMPPSDFRPPLERPAAEPTLDELLDLWTAQERRRSQRAREAEWRRVQDDARRTAQGEIIARKGEANLPASLRVVDDRGRQASRTGRLNRELHRAAISTRSLAPASTPDRLRAGTGVATTRAGRRQRDRIGARPTGKTVEVRPSSSAGAITEWASGGGLVGWLSRPQCQIAPGVSRVYWLRRA